MGYHLTIVREGKDEISEGEFARVIAGVPELRYDPAVGKVEYFRGDELRATLMLQDGRVWTAVAEPDVIRMMARLAREFGGRAFGDEGEWYSEDGEAHPDETSERERLEDLARFKRRRLIWNIVRMLILAVCAYLIYRRHSS